MNNAIQSAIDWWLEKMEQRAIGTSGDADIDMMYILTHRGGGIPPLTDQQKATFKAALERILASHLERFGDCVLSTDYGPEGWLGDALAEAEINDAVARLPMKTIMWIDPRKVTVKCGYGAQETKVWMDNERN